MGLGQYLERLREAVNRSVEIRGGQDIMVHQSDGGVLLTLNPRISEAAAGPVLRHFKITAVTEFSDVNGPVLDGDGTPTPIAWEYDVEEQFKRFRKYGVFGTSLPWRTLPGGFVGKAYGYYEPDNTKTTTEPQQATGMIHGNDYPLTWNMTPLKEGATYPGMAVDVLDDARVVCCTEILLLGPYGEDGTCS